MKDEFDRGEAEADELDILWGAGEISRFLSTDRRRVFRCLQSGLIPARKIGSRWVASRASLREHFAGMNLPGD